MRWALFVLLSGCVEEKADTGAPPLPPWMIDDDGDDHTADVDCDDADAGIHPGAAERCDGLDQDCDGLVDDAALDAPDWYPDADADGHGDAFGATPACDPVPGYLDAGDDCDDSDAAVFPGADERCNERDDNCDGVADEGVPTDSPTWYGDADTDGYGDATEAVVSCPAPDGYVADATDCDDRAADVSPAGVETCDGRDEDCDGVVDDAASDGTEAWLDADGDGWGDPVTAARWCPSTRPPDVVDRAGDCDDADAAVSPDALETCDAADEDCDGVVDDDPVDPSVWYRDADGDGAGDEAGVAFACDAPAGFVASAGDCDDADPALVTRLWYADADADGYGDPGSSETACGAPDGFVSDATDCDDTNGTVSPSASERCGGADENCDGAVDEDTAVDAGTWYADADADGHGDPAVSAAACAALPGFVASAADCDDTDSAVSIVTWYADADADGYGAAASPVEVCAAPVGFVAADGDCDDTNPLAAPGRPEVCDDGADNDCDGTDNGCVRGGDLALASVYHARIAGGPSYARVGHAVAQVGDVDGDGVADFVVGAEAIGEAWLYAGGATGDLDAFDTAAAVYGTAAQGWGSAVAGLGDFDGDGIGDVAVGAPDSAGGAAAVILGPWTTDLPEADAPLHVRGGSAGDSLGGAVAGAGDLDGDGLRDLLIGDTTADGVLANAGAVLVVYGGAASGELGLDTADGVIYGPHAYAGMGRSLAGVGDVDGDGLDDVLIGGSLDRTVATSAGAAYLFLGPVSGASTTAGATATFLGEASTNFAGASVASAGDIDGDGTIALLVGATHYDGGGADAGAAYLLRGPFGGVTSLADAAAVLVGATRGEQAGGAVAGVGDLNADGFADIAVGASLSRDAGIGAGGVYVLYGPTFASGSLGLADLFLYGTAASYAGYALSGVPTGGDLTGDGVPDLLLGAPVDDVSGGASGAAYVVPGRGL